MTPNEICSAIAFRDNHRFRWERFWRRCRAQLRDSLDFFMVFGIGPLFALGVIAWAVWR